MPSSGHLSDLPVFHPKLNIGQLCGLGATVGDVQGGDGVFTLHPLEQGGEVFAEVFVEGGERFVEDEDFRTRSESPSKSDALALATGEILREAIKQMRDPKFRR